MKSPATFIEFIFIGLTSFCEFGVAVAELLVSLSKRILIFIIETHSTHPVLQLLLTLGAIAYFYLRSRSYTTKINKLQESELLFANYIAILQADVDKLKSEKTQLKTRMTKSEGFISEMSKNIQGFQETFRPKYMYYISSPRGRAGKISQFNNMMKFLSTCPEGIMSIFVYTETMNFDSVEVSHSLELNPTDVFETVVFYDLPGSYDSIQKFLSRHLLTTGKVIFYINDTDVISKNNILLVNRNISGVKNFFN